MSTPRLARLLPPLLLTLAVGCFSPSGESADLPGEEATVTGQVLIKGRKVTSGTIVFQPQGGDPIEAAVQPDGTYSLRTVAGMNTVTVQGDALEKAAANMPMQAPQDVQPGDNIVDLVY